MKSKSRELKFYRFVGTEFEIDEAGRIWRIAIRRGRIGSQKLRPCQKHRAENRITTGYLQVHVRFENQTFLTLAHRLVWLHFNGPIPGDLVINHKNGIADDNRPENLEVVTMRENIRHSIYVLKRSATLTPGWRSTRQADGRFTRVALERNDREFIIKDMAERNGVTVCPDREADIRLARHIGDEGAAKMIEENRDFIVNKSYKDSPLKAAIRIARRRVVLLNRLKREGVITSRRLPVFQCAMEYRLINQPTLTAQERAEGAAFAEKLKERYGK